MTSMDRSLRRASAGLMITTLVIATGMSAVPGQAATPDPARAEGSGAGWKEIPTSPPTERVTLEDAWSDGTDVWSVGAIGDLDETPWIKRCSSTACVTEELDLPSGMTGSLAAIDGTSASDIWAVGRQTASDNPYPETLAAHYDGTAWTVIPTPPEDDELWWYLSAVAAVTHDDVWAIGAERYNSDEGDLTTTAGYLLHWDGTDWSEVPVPEIGCQYEDHVDLLVTEDGTLLTAGQCGNESSGADSAGFVHSYRPGDGWQMLLDLRDRWESGRLTDFLSIAQAGDDVWVVGRQFRSHLSHRHAMAYRLDDGEWKKTAVPRRTTFMASVAGAENGHVWAAGFRGWSNTRRPEVMHWTDDRWTTIRVRGRGQLTGVALDSAGAPWVVGYHMHDWNHVDPLVLRRTGAAG